MSKFQTLFNKFTIGEVSPKMLSLVDYPGYSNACQKARNVCVIPQGGAKRRFGTNYVDVVLDRTADPMTPITNPAFVQQVTYIQNPTTKFKMIMRPDTTSGVSMDIYLNQSLITSVGMPDYKPEFISKVQFIAGQSRIIVCHPSVPPHELILGILNSVWTYNQIVFRQLPTYDYSSLDGTPYFSQTFTITPDGGMDLDTEGATLTIASDGTPFNNNHLMGGFIFGSLKIRITAVVSTASVTGMVITGYGSTPASISAPGTECFLSEILWNNGALPTETPDYYLWDYNLSVASPSNYTMGTTVTITAVNGPAGDGPFTMSTENQFLMFGGTLQFDTYTNSNVMVGTVTVSFNVPLTSNIFVPGPYVSITNSDAPIASPSRGWPATGGIYQGRLILGRNHAAPFRAAASATFDFYDMDDVGAIGGIDTDGFGFNVGSEGNEIIQRIVGNKSFVALGYNGPSASSLFEQMAMSPNSFFITQQTNDGATDVDAVVIDNQILYIHSNEQNVLAMTYDIGQSGYQITNANILAPELVHYPTHATAYRPNTNDGNFYLVTNDDGTMACLQTIDNERIKAWTLHSTNGYFLDIEGAKDECSALVLREVSTGSTTEGLIDSSYTVDTTFQAFTDITSQINNIGGPATIFVNNGDYFMVGCQIYTTKLAVTLTTPASTSITPTFEYLTASGWRTFVPTDGTNGFTQAGSITWNASQVTEWLQAQPNPYAVTPYTNNNYYYIRIKRTAATLVTKPSVTQIFSNVADRIYYEEITFNSLTDCTITTSADSSGNISGLSALAGQIVFPYVNGFPSQSVRVNSDGTVAFGSWAANQSVVIGIDFKVEIVPMPVALQTLTGWNVYEPKSIKNVYLDFYQTLGLTFNGTPVQASSFQDLMFQETLIPESGFKKVPTFSGWNPRTQLTISQSYPAPMILRAVAYVVEV